MAEATPDQGGAAGMTAEQIQKLVTDAVSAAVKPVMDAIGQQQRALGAASVRDRYIGEKLRDLPEIYRQQLSQTDDLHKLAQDEQRVRDIYRRDFAAAGGKVPDVGGGNPGGASPMQMSAADNKASATEHIAAGLNQRPQQAGAAAPTWGQQRAAEAPNVQR